MEFGGAAPAARRAEVEAPADGSPRAIWIIAAAAAALRLFPIWFGLPYLHARPDEGAAIGHAMAILEGDPNPHFFHWPSLTFYLFAGLFHVASLVRGAVTGDAALAATDQILVGRATVALAGAATVVVLYRLGRHVAGTAAGLVAAAFLAVAVLHVRDSHFAMTDVLMTLLFTGSLLCLARGVDRGPFPGPFAAAGVFAGLATSTKYSAAALLAGMAAAQIVLAVRAFLRRVAEDAGRRVRLVSIRLWVPALVFAAALAAGFLAATPYAILDAPRFSADLAFDVAHLSTGHGINLGRGWIYHLTHSLPHGAGIPVALAAVAGIVPLARLSPAHAFVIGSAALALYASIGSGYTVFFRYVLPLVPIVCLFAAVAVVRAGGWLAARAGLRTASAVVLLAALAGAPSLVNSVWFDAVLARTDTRVLASRWLAPRVRPGDTLYDSGGDYARLDLGRTAYHEWRYDPATRSFGHPEGHTPDWLVLHQSPLRTYAAHPAHVRRLASERYDLVWETRPTRGPAAAAVYDMQDAFFVPVSGFRTVERPGPTILIYRRREP